jgi:NAD(P)-dependent dehydrogenase (short-subunit alcohol dehydrogenase family)
MPTIFISGANRGLGLEFARQYAMAGWHVLAGCRDPSRAAELGSIAGVETIALNVDDPDSIVAAVQAVGERGIDLLLNNAGIYGSIVGDSEQTLANVNLDVWGKVFQTNVIGPFALTRALLPRLKAGAIIGILSSELGSITKNSMGQIYAYRSSKAAVNMVGKSLAIDLAPRGIIVVLLHPGWAHTDMGGPTAPVDPVESIAGLRKVLAAVSPDSSGRFLAWDGREMPW